MTFRSRFFSADSDLARLVEFLGTANRDARGYWHPGDLIWALYQSATFDPTASIRLWENESGEILGFTIHEAANLVMAQVHPRVRDRRSVEEAMLAWAVEHTQTLLGQNGDPNRRSGLKHWTTTRPAAPFWLNRAFPATTTTTCACAAISPRCRQRPSCRLASASAISARRRISSSGSSCTARSGILPR